CALATCGLPDAVQMNQDMVTRGRIQDRLGELDALLVVMIEEVHHHAAPAQFFERGERFLHASTKRALMDPGPKPHPFGSRVAPDGWEVESSARTRDIRVRPWLDARLRLVIPR